MDPEPGYRFRAPTKDDLDAVTAVLIADQLASGGTATLDSDFVSNRWGRPDFDLARDAWVAVDGGGLVVGYGTVERGAASIVGSWGIVHPDHRGRGIGSALLDRIEARAAELLEGVPEPRFRHAINAGDRAAESNIRARGLQSLRHFWHMQLDLPGPVASAPDPGAQPEGIEIAAIRYPDDLRAVHAILMAAFEADPSHHPEPFDRWLEEETGTPHFDPSLWLLARDGGGPLATLTASILRDVGWVDYLGVLPRARGRGVGAALLLRAFATFAERGIRTIRLSVDAENPTGATALYERVGMRVVWAWDLWERGPGPQPTGANSRMTEAKASTA